MTANNPDHMTDADWNRVFNNPAVLEVIDNCPSNNARYHDEEEDERILERARRNAPWFNRIMREAMAEMEK